MVRQSKEKGEAKGANRDRKKWPKRAVQTVNTQIRNM